MYLYPIYQGNSAATMFACQGQQSSIALLLNYTSSAVTIPMISVGLKTQQVTHFPTGYQPQQIPPTHWPDSSHASIHSAGLMCRFDVPSIYQTCLVCPLFKSCANLSAEYWLVIQFHSSGFALASARQIAVCHPDFEPIQQACFYHLSGNNRQTLPL